MNLCLLRAVIAVQNDNRLRYFVYCPARASVTVIVHRTRVRNAPHNSDADACAPKSRLNIIVRAHARIRISMRMHTYTCAYAIYKVARDRVITWGEDTVFLYFLHLCVIGEWFLSELGGSLSPNVPKHTENSGFDGQYVR